MSGPFLSSRARSFVSFSIIAGLESAAFCRFAGGLSDSFLSESSSPESLDSEPLSWASGLFESCISFPRSAKPVFNDAVKPVKAEDSYDCKIFEN